MEKILTSRGFVQSAIPKQYNWYNTYKAILWNNGNTITLIQYTPNQGRLIDSTTIVGTGALIEFFENNNWMEV